MTHRPTDAECDALTSAVHKVLIPDADFDDYDRALIRAGAEWHAQKPCPRCHWTLMECVTGSNDEAHDQRPESINQGSTPSGDHGAVSGHQQEPPAPPGYGWPGCEQAVLNRKPAPPADALSHAWKSGYAQAKEEDRMARDFCPHCSPCLHDGGDKCRSPNTPRNNLPAFTLCAAFSCQMDEGYTYTEDGDTFPCKKWCGNEAKCSSTNREELHGAFEALAREESDWDRVGGRFDRGGADGYIDRYIAEKWMFWLHGASFAWMKASSVEIDRDSEQRWANHYAARAEATEAKLAVAAKVIAAADRVDRHTDNTFYAWQKYDAARAEWEPKP